MDLKLVCGEAHNRGGICFMKVIKQLAHECGYSGPEAQRLEAGKNANLVNRHVKGMAFRRAPGRDQQGLRHVVAQFVKMQQEHKNIGKVHRKMGQKPGRVWWVIAAFVHA